MKRILLKLSGEALAGAEKKGFDEATVIAVAKQIRTDRRRRNSGRDRDRRRKLLERTYQRDHRPQQGRSDRYAGYSHELYLCIRYLQICRTSHRDFTPFVCGAFTSLYSKDAVEEGFAQGKVLFFAGGTGHPYFSTDTATVLRAVEIEAEAILLAKAVDGIYDSDPKVNPNAVKYDEISIQEVVDKKLAAMDLTASIMCLEQKMPMLVFGLEEENSIINTVHGKFNGTKVTV